MKVVLTIEYPADLDLAARTGPQAWLDGHRWPEHRCIRQVECPEPYQAPEDEYLWLSVWVGVEPSPVNA